MPLYSPLPPYPSKLVDYLTLTDSQFYDQAGRAMKIRDINEVKRAIHSLEEDPMGTRNLFQQIEYEDAEDYHFKNHSQLQLTPHANQTATSSVPCSTYNIQLHGSSTEHVQDGENKPLTDHPLEPPPFPSMTLDYMTLTDAQLYERAPLCVYSPSGPNAVRQMVDELGKVEARKYFQELERVTASCYFNPKTKQIGRKPASGEELVYAELGDNVTIRLWRGDIEEDNMFCLDFVYSNDRSRYRRKPANIKLYSYGLLGGEIFSIEQAFDALEKNLVKNARGFAAWQQQPNIDQEWETFLVPERSTIDVVQDAHHGTLQVPTSSKGDYLVPVVGYAL
ncbi:hypothetical protein BDQ17DRAFT_1425086 [Cyathus striatus]|nr:hypothetical protein BDQ17DRAFT_1425086 [Cyathus striatus]